MNRFLKHSGLAALIVSVLLMNTRSASGQHADIDFSYQGDMIAVEFGHEWQVFEGNFPTSGPFEQFAFNPGFGTHEPVNPDDVLDYKILGPLGYHNGTSFAPVPAGANIIIADNPTGQLIVDGSTAGPVTGPGVIGKAGAGGDFHSHVDFELAPLSLDAPEFGAYGLLMELSTDAAGIANSDPFYIVLNFGLDEAVFEGAVGDFAAQIPEPASLTMAGAGLVCLCLALRRRGRSPRRSA